MMESDLKEDIPRRGKTFLSFEIIGERNSNHSEIAIYFEESKEETKNKEDEKCLTSGNPNQKDLMENKNKKEDFKVQKKVCDIRKGLRLMDTNSINSNPDKTNVSLVKSNLLKNDQINDENNSLNKTSKNVVKKVNVISDLRKIRRTSKVLKRLL